MRRIVSFFMLVTVMACQSAPPEMTAPVEKMPDAIQEEPFLLGDGTLGLGMAWNPENQDRVILTAGVVGRRVGITGLAFNADGQVVRTTPLRGLTNYDGTIAGKQASTRDFSMPLAQFKLLENAENVEMILSLAGKEQMSATFTNLDQLRVRKFGQTVAASL